MHDTDQPPTHEPGPGTYELPDERQGQPPTLMPKVEVEIEVRDPDGALVERTRCAANLATDNWLAFAEALLTQTASTVQQTASLTDDTGTAQTVQLYDDAGTFFGDDTGGDVGPYLAYGDGGGAAVDPNRGDMDLDNRLARAAADAPTKPQADQIRIEKTFTNSTGATQTVREVGLFYQWEDAAGGGPHQFLCWHDAVGATDVADGQDVTVRYTITWP
jgi:hypothetical protein